MKGSGAITLKEIRKQLKLTSEGFAELLGLSRTTYFYRLNGKQPWLLPELILIAGLIKWKPIEIEVNGELYRITIKRNNRK